MVLITDPGDDWRIPPVKIKDILSGEGMDPYFRYSALALILNKGKGIIPDEVYEEVEKEIARYDYQ